MHLRRSLRLDDYPPIPAFSWMGSLSPLVVVPAVLPAVALFLAPLNVLDAAPFLRAFTNWMTSRIPYMTGHSGATQIPQVATLVNCLVVVAAAVIATVFTAQATVNYRYLYRRHVASGPHPLRMYFVGLLGLPLMISAVAVMVMIPGDPSWARGATQSRTLIYGFLAVTIPYLTGLAVGGAPLMLRLFLDAYLFSSPITLTEKQYDAPNWSFHRVACGVR